MDNLIFQNDLIKVEVEPSQIPWLKIFTQKKIKEFSQCDTNTKQIIWKAIDIIEKEMLSYFQCEKINIASFGNYVPHVHFHIMARFKEDNFFPEPMWGTQQRESKLDLPSFETFFNNISTKLSNL
jgi:diadenosine tetraphosphate (Ap4A) HIT family hydrolase